MTDMVQTCSKCSRRQSRRTPFTATIDGLVLGGHSRNGGPVAVGSQAFASPFVFPTGKTCRSFNELALACQDDWNTARDLLQQGYLETFLGGLGRIDLVMAAKEAAKFPDPTAASTSSSASSQPTSSTAQARLRNAGDQSRRSADRRRGREFKLHMENQGMRLLYGSVTCTDGLWLSARRRAPARPESTFSSATISSLPVHVVGDRLRAGNKPLEAHLTVETNGGAATCSSAPRCRSSRFPAACWPGQKPAPGRREGQGQSQGGGRAVRERRSGRLVQDQRLDLSGAGSAGVRPGRRAAVLRGARPDAGRPRSRSTSSRSP